MILFNQLQNLYIKLTKYKKKLKVGDPFSNAISYSPKYVGNPLTSVGNTSIYGFHNDSFLLYSYNR